MRTSSTSIQASPDGRRRLRGALAAVAATAALLAGGALVVPSVAGAYAQSPAQAACQDGPLSTNGAEIVNARGARCILTGVNWFGFETQNHVVHGLWTRGYDEMLSQIADLGFNAIRIPFSIEAIESSQMTSINYAAGRNADLQGKTPLEALETIVDAAAARGLLVLLDLHSLRDDGFTEPLWYDDRYSERDFAAAWRTMATRFGQRPNVIGADVKNEPHGEATWGDGSQTDWRREAEKVGDEIHQIAPKWLIVVEGIEGHTEGQQLDSHWWGGNLEGVRRNPVVLDEPGKLVYSPHEYGPGVWPQAWFAQEDFTDTLYERWAKGFGYILDAQIAPVLVGEFGGRETGTDTKEGRWQRQFMDYLSQRGISFTYWAWNPNSGDTGGVLNDDWRTVNAQKVRPAPAGDAGRTDRLHRLRQPAAHSDPRTGTCAGARTRSRASARTRAGTERRRERQGGDRDRLRLGQRLLRDAEGDQRRHQPGQWARVRPHDAGDDHIQLERNVQRRHGHDRNHRAGVGIEPLPRRLLCLHRLLCEGREALEGRRDLRGRHRRRSQNPNRNRNPNPRRSRNRRPNPNPSRSQSPNPPASWRRSWSTPTGAAATASSSPPATTAPPRSTASASASTCPGRSPAPGTGRSPEWAA